MVTLRPTLLLIAGALVAFGLGLWAPFAFDDHLLLLDERLSLSSGWRHVFELRQTRPLTWLTFWVNRQWSADPLGFHAVNLLLHLAAVLVACQVLPAVAGVGAGWCGAVFFALHPLQTEAVVNVHSRAIVLATLLCLLAWRDWESKRHWRAVAWFAFALLAKEEVIAFPAFLWFVSSRRIERKGPWAAMWALALVAGLRVLWAANTVMESGIGSQAGITPWDYFSIQAGVVLRYLGQVAAPFGLTPDPDPPRTSAWLWLFVLLSRGWLIPALILLAPSSSVFPSQDLAADRRMYFALLPAGAALGRLVPRRWLPAIGLALIALSIHQTYRWLDERRLWAYAVAQAPEKARPARQLARISGPGEAMRLLERFPKDAYARNDLGRLYLERRDAAAALREFGHALALRPNDAMILNNRGAALLVLGQTEAAKEDFRRALKADPCQRDARINLTRLGDQVAIHSDCPPVSFRP